MNATNTILFTNTDLNAVLTIINNILAFLWINIASRFLDVCAPFLVLSGPQPQS